ncbi:hypothetical protein ACL60U_08935 [Escherichia coli]|uniref:hypothetical protein n=1 Tax=Escherichia coli TaxID=562 RepID=UPI00406913F5
MLGGADNPNGELPSYITGADTSHEDDISAYMRYRFDRAGLTASSLNMQLLAKETF